MISEPLPRVNQILRHPLFQQQLNQLDALEQERVFCRHGLEHLLATARLAYIHALEEHLSLDPELIYAAALLHDIGRAEQYRSGQPHEQAAAVLAEPILAECGFSPAEQREILTAIASHRNSLADSSHTLSILLRRADQESRLCFRCPAAEACYWPPHRRTQSLQG